MSRAAGAGYDCVIVGAGHNGLVCAAYLARAGRSVLVVEAAEQVGGAAVTREFFPGFRVSAGAHLLPFLSASLIRDLRLESHGLSFAARALPSVALSESDDPLIIGADALSRSDGHPASDRLAADAQAFVGFASRLRRIAAALRPLIEAVPPRLGSGAWSDTRRLLRIGWDIRRLGRSDMRELLRIAGMNVHDYLEEHFSSSLVKGALGLDAVLGSCLGPRSPGSMFTLLHRLASSLDGQARGRVTELNQPRGGLGAVSQALAAAACGAGAQIRTGTAAERVIVREHRVAGVRLSSGEEIAAGAVISNADPQSTFLRLLGAEHLDAGFVRRVSHLRTRGAAAKLHLALGVLPRIAALESRLLAGRLLISPSLEYLERAFNHCKYGEFSAAPALEITIPSLNDPSLAPPGRHVLSAIVQYAPYTLHAGWETGKGRLAETLIGILDSHAPGLRSSILAWELLVPPDIEREFRISGGHWHHAELALDQFFMLRPLPGAAQYATPVEGLYLCGAGCHPGGGVMGIAGRNAARQVLARAA